MRKHLSTLLKIGITVAGLIFVLRQIDLSEIGPELANLQWSWLTIAFLLFTVGLVVRAYRWLLLLRGLGIPVAFKRLLELYFVGNFFNSFLPTGFGGDVVRVFEVSQDVPANIAAGTVIVDRLTGLLMLFAMALVALPFRPASFPNELLWQITAVSLIGLIGGFILLEGNLIRRLGGWLPGKLSVTDDRQPLAKLLQAVQGCGWPAVGGALAVSVGFNLILAGYWAATGYALGYVIPYSYYLLVIPILSVTLLVPSIGGLGVREVAATILFVGAGLTDTQAVTLSLIVFILTRVSGLLGAPIYLASLMRRNKVSKTVDVPPTTL